MTDESASAGIISWSNTGFVDNATIGLYTGTGQAGRPAGSTGNFDGLTIHPDLPKIYVSKMQAVSVTDISSYWRGEKER